MSTKQGQAQPTQIVLSEDQRLALEQIVRAHSSGQALVRRARVVLLAAMGYSNMDIARAVPMDEEAVGLWRRRWHTWRAVSMEDLSVADRLTDAPRPGAVPRLTAEQVCQIVALACEQPTDCGRPVSQWSHRELADEIVRRGITERISPRHAARLLKSGRPPAASGAVLAHPGRRRRPRHQDR
jgi:putative transposase